MAFHLVNVGLHRVSRLSKSTRPSLVTAGSNTKRVDSEGRNEQELERH